MPPVVSIIIPAFNEERYLGVCLSSIAATDPAIEYEVLIIDNGSTDRTVDIARQYYSRLPVRIEVCPGVHVSALRNLGASLSDGAYLAFIDADCAVDSDWLRVLSDLLPKNGRRVIGSRYRIAPDSSWVARSWYADALVRGPVSYVPGGSLNISKEEFVAIGGFDESLETNEDYEFCQRAREAGLAIWSDPSIAVIHFGTPQTITEFFRKHRWHGTHVFKVFWQSLPKLRNLKAVGYTLYLIAAVAALAVGIGIWVCFHSSTVFFVAAAAMLAGPAVLAIVRARSQHRLLDTPQLFLLFFIYGMARVCSLLRFRAQRSDQIVPVNAAG